MEYTFLNTLFSNFEGKIPLSHNIIGLINGQLKNYQIWKCIMIVFRLIKSFLFCLISIS